MNISLNNPGNVTVEVLNLLGRSVQVMDLGWQNQESNVQIDVSSMPAGIYFLRLNSGNLSYTEKLIISR